MLMVWSGWWWLRKTWVTASGATPSAASGSRISERDLTMPGSTTIRASPSRTSTIGRADALVGVPGVEQVDAGHRRAPVRGASVYERRCRRSAKPTRPNAAPPRAATGRNGRRMPSPRVHPAHHVEHRARRPRPDRGTDLHRRRRRDRGPGRWPSATGASSHRGHATPTAMATVGPRTRVIDLRGRTVTPGFGDSHVHPPIGGLARIRCELHDARGKDAYLEIVAAYAASHPDVEWIQGGGWSLADFPGGVAAPRGPRPRRPGPPGVPAQPRRPRRLGELEGARARRHHARTRPTRPTAASPATRTAPRWARSTRARWTSSSALIPPPTPADLRRGAPREPALPALAWASPTGRTPGSRPTTQAAYLALAASGELTARVVGAHVVGARARHRADRRTRRAARQRAARPVQRDQRQAHGRRHRREPDGVDARAVLRRPRRTRRPTAGIDFIDPELLKQVVVKIDALGFQPHFHALGDRAVRQALDAVEAARRGQRLDRHAAAPRPHPGGPPRRPPALPPARRARQRAAATGRSEEDQMTELTLPFLGPVVSARQYPFRSLLRHGATLVMGSDWSVSTPDPLLEMEVAVNRVSPTSARPRAVPARRADLAGRRPCAAFTAGSAHAQHLDEAGRLGRGQAGRLRDPGPRPVRSRPRARSARRACSGRSSRAWPSTRRPGWTDAVGPPGFGPQGKVSGLPGRRFAAWSHPRPFRRPHSRGFGRSVAAQSNRRPASAEVFPFQSTC